MLEALPGPDNLVGQPGCAFAGHDPAGGEFGGPPGRRHIAHHAFQRRQEGKAIAIPGNVQRLEVITRPAPRQGCDGPANRRVATGQGRFR